ncbi:MAG: MarR family transcriptional regulator [Planctomycetes bacterium]|nr:MarR family transcriptional regulator [Planctomycetota bacterium]
MPTLQQAQELKDFVEEIFSISKAFWGAQSRARGRQETEITETEFLTLDLLLRDGNSMTVGDIQRQIGVLPAQMSRVIRSLEAKTDGPLITCKINPSDKRKIDVELTDAGRQAHQQYRRVKLGSIEKMLLNLTDQDRADLMRLLRKVRDSLHNHQ